MSLFEYRDPDGDRLRVEPFPGRPAILLILGTQGEDDVASLRIPTAHLEEVIAGIRDMARQASGQPAPLRRRLTEAEHDRAWHAIEGTAGDDGADPGSVLTAVLHALNIDPPGVVHGCPPTGSGLTPCCGRTPFELPLADRISSEATVTCAGPAEGAGA
ncbi:hypothetical protein ACFWNQ_15150 [Streptomyces virginiae]|uniref:hypothetical protein n=1 Tax=Streptomyces virginiae TaxID=1961 RepID=UPI00365813A4